MRCGSSCLGLGWTCQGSTHTAMSVGWLCLGRGAGRRILAPEGQGQLVMWPPRYLSEGGNEQASVATPSAWCSPGICWICASGVAQNALLINASF